MAVQGRVHGRYEIGVLVYIVFFLLTFHAGRRKGLFSARVGGGGEELALSVMQRTYRRSAYCDASALQSTALWWDGGKSLHRKLNHLHLFYDRILELTGCPAYGGILASVHNLFTFCERMINSRSTHGNTAN